MYRRTRIGQRVDGRTCPIWWPPPIGRVFTYFFDVVIEEVHPHGADLPGAEAPRFYDAKGLDETALHNSHDGDAFACPQTAEYKSYRGTLGFEGAFCDNLFRAVRKSLILKRRDVGVVDRARLESEACEQHGATPKRLNAHAISDLTFQNDHSVCVRKPRCSSRF